MLFTIISLLLVAILITIGVTLGFIFMDHQLSRGLKIALISISRLVIKSIWRWKSPIDINKLQRDKDFSSMPTSLREELIDKTALNIARELKSHLQKKYNSQFHSLFLYGSRVRGDYHANSDIDLAIFFAHPRNNYNNIREELLQCTYKLLLKYGMYTQTRIYDSSILLESDNCSDYLARAAMLYGVSV